jgi:hypothetical protein
MPAMVKERKLGLTKAANEPEATGLVLTAPSRTVREC